MFFAINLFITTSIDINPQNKLLTFTIKVSQDLKLQLNSLEVFKCLLATRMTLKFSGEVVAEQVLHKEAHSCRAPRKEQSVIWDLQMKEYVVMKRKINGFSFACSACHRS